MNATGYTIRRIGAMSPTLTAARVLSVSTYSIWNSYKFKHGTIIVARQLEGDSHRHHRRTADRDTDRYGFNALIGQTMTPSSLRV